MTRDHSSLVAQGHVPKSKLEEALEYTRNNQRDLERFQALRGQSEMPKQGSEGRALTMSYFHEAINE